MTRTWRPILPSEFHRIRMAGTAGFSFGEIGREFGRRTGTIARLFAPVRERRSGKVPAGGARSPIVDALTALRPAHFSAYPISAQWFEQCDVAFRSAILREHPETVAEASQIARANQSASIHGMNSERFEHGAER